MKGGAHAKTTRRIRTSYIARRQYWGLAFVLPTVIFFAVFFLFPILSGIYYSFTDFTLLKPPVWVGLQNYKDLLTDRLFLKSIAVTLGFVAGTTIPAWILSLLAAQFVSFQNLKVAKYLRSFFLSCLTFVDCGRYCLAYFVASQWCIDNGVEAVHRGRGN